jgi:hypothetical protein
MIETAKEVGIFVTLMGPPLRRSQDDIGQRVAGRIAEQKLRGGALELGTSFSGHYYNRSPRARADRVSLYRRALLAHYPRCAHGLKAEPRAPGQRAAVPAELQNLVPDARHAVIRQRSRAAVLTARRRETAPFDSLQAIRHLGHQLN